MTEENKPRFTAYGKKWGSKLRKMTTKVEEHVAEALRELSAEQTELAGKKISQSKINNDLLLKDPFIRERVKQLKQEKRNETKESTTTS